ncbi:MAG: hypothetical protein ACK587_09885 [Cyanobacteriota bacterium]
MTDYRILDARYALIDSLVDALAIDRKVFDAMIKDFCRVKDIGPDIARSIQNTDDLRNCADSLLDKCEAKRGEGWILLKRIVYRHFGTKEYDVFAKALQSYCELLDSLSSDERSQLQHEPICQEMPQASNSDLFINYSSEDLKKARYVLHVMSWPGEPFATQCMHWRPNENLNDSDFRVFLRDVINQASPQVSKEFVLRMRQEEVEERAFLLIYVEESDCLRYTLHADIVTREKPKPIDVNLVDEGLFSEYSRDNVLLDGLPKFAGQLIKSYGRLYTHLFLEIFLPNNLLLHASKIRIDSISSGEIDRVGLSSCEVPTVLRSLNRAKELMSLSSSNPFMAGKKRLVKLSAKWNSLQRGQGKLYPVIHEAHSELKALRLALSDQNMVGVMFILDLPSSRVEKERIIASVIDSHVPVCAWWSPSDEETSSVAEDITELKKRRLDCYKRRLDCLLECFDPRCQSNWTRSEDEAKLRDGECIDEKKKKILDLLSEYLDLDRIADPLHKEEVDLMRSAKASKTLAAPSRLYAMEIIAKQIKEMVIQSHSLIPNLLLLVDHPTRWPAYILDRHQEGAMIRIKQ